MLFSPSGVASPGGRRLRFLQPKALSVACQGEEVFETQSLDLVLKSLRELLEANPFKQLVVGLSGTPTDARTGHKVALNPCDLAGPSETITPELGFHP